LPEDEAVRVMNHAYDEVRKKKKDAEKEKKKARARVELQRGKCQQGSPEVVEEEDDDDEGGDDSDSSVLWDELVGKDEGLFPCPTTPGPMLHDPLPASVQVRDEARREPADAGHAKSGLAPLALRPPRRREGRTHSRS
jgi:hypothetical protein